MDLYSRFEPHSHTYYSNIRLPDCINTPQALIDRALDLGLSGIAITDHESLGGAVEVKKYEKIIQQEHPEFKVALGNEIYLTPNRENKQDYFHFILIAKNDRGFRALKELSSKAWLNGYTERKQFRVPTLYSELSNIVKRFPNSLIATTACLGGEVSKRLSRMIYAEKVGDTETVTTEHNAIVNFMLWCKKLFGEDFYIECAPGSSKEQIEVNKRLKSLSACFDVPMVIGTDSHYLAPSDRYIHEAYLKSKDGDREVASFYEYAYLQSNEEIFTNLLNSDFDRDFCLQLFNNSNKIYNKIENYNIFKTQQIPTVPVKNYEKSDWALNDKNMKDYPYLSEMFNSDDTVKRYWINECWDALDKKVGKWSEHTEYVQELEEEARVKSIISEKLNNNMFQYPVTLQHYIDMIWDCGSTIGAGRGSACAGLNHYLLGITQLDPIQHNFPFFRYLNEERVELGSL